MSKLFYVKTDDEEQVKNKIYKAKKTFLGSIHQGDYAFIRLAGEMKGSHIRRLWQVKELKEYGDVTEASFDEVALFDPVKLADFTNLDIFMLDKNLLNQVNKQTRGRSFVELHIVSEKDFLNAIKDFSSYVEDKSHHRRVKKFDKKEDIVTDSIDIQFYKEGDLWKIHWMPFYGDDFKKQFNANNFLRYNPEEKRSTKQRTFKFFSGKAKAPSIVGVWDLFCTQNKTTSQSNIKAGSKEPEKSVTDPKLEYVPSGYAKDLINAKNIIFHGAPGTGKTYLAQKIAAEIVSNGECDQYDGKKLTAEQRAAQKEQISFVQFHPSYDYADFVEGIRPVKGPNGIEFELRPGTFKSFVERAIKAYNEYNGPKENAPKYVFIIDEINRGEISKIFGELFFSIDPDYRGKGGVITQYANLHTDSTEKFYVPENVYIIGTMNDIDRSVDSFDLAMRRRFRFIELKAEDRAEDMLWMCELSHL